MRFDVLLSALVMCTCGIPAAASSAGSADSRAVQVLQRSSDMSAAKRQQPRQAPPPVVRWHGADPSIGPDGRPYRVPEYLRGQCYIDEGYGRFSACPSR